MEVRANRLVITNKAECTGCGACHNICPRGAITMKWDKEGFPYPEIDDQCIDCGMCCRVCPLIRPLPNYGAPLEKATVYAASSNDAEHRIQSTSGGIFSELALYMYQQGGVVVGAVYDQAFMIHHMCSELPEDLVRLRQSKYAQSDIRLVFREIEQVLAQGRSVLFCGTPCQAAGLRAYLGRVPEGLLLCDFVCRGVNSPKVYRAYLDGLEKRHGSGVTQLQFKNKDFGWNRFHTKVTFADGSVYQKDRYHDLFMQAYLKYNLIIRPCCHVCQFTEAYRNTDITLGDFWGVGRYEPDLDDDKGTSLLLANTDKGRRAIARLRRMVHIRRMQIDHIYGGNKCLTVAVSPGENRAKFFENLGRLGFDKSMRRCTRKTFVQKVWRLLHHRFV